jgi:hypothetical protein
VWAVSHGSYSDYGVSAIFPTEELATAHLEQMKGYERTDSFVESFPFFDALPEVIPIFHRRGRIANGRIMESEDYEVVTFEYSDGTAPVTVTEWGDPLSERIINVYGSDFERCRKSYNDRVAQAVAMSLGGEP